MLIMVEGKCTTDRIFCKVAWQRKGVGGSGSASPAFLPHLPPYSFYSFYTFSFSLQAASPSATKPHPNST